VELIRFVIQNPVKVAVGVILLVMFGLLSVLRIPTQLTPDVDRPIITVTTHWTGASPQEIESEIVDRQEEKLKSVSGLWKMTSFSREGEATVQLEFPVGVDKDAALRDVSDKLRQVSEYPEEVDEPTVTAADPHLENIVAWMILRAPPGVRIAKYKTFIEDKVRPQLERAQGITEVPVYGGLDREIQVMVEAARLASRGLTMRDLELALRRQNENVSAGTIAQGKRDFTYRTVGEYTSVTDVEDTVVVYREGGPVFVRDVATVVDGFKKQRNFVRSKGDFVIVMPARRETGANVLTAIKNLKEKIELVNREILGPEGSGFRLDLIYSEATYITSAIHLVFNNIVFGSMLAVAVLMLFLRSGSATGIIAVTIPISVVGTFLMISVLGRSLNVVMLAGMAFAVGMVVDNAIVVLENIYRHRTMGKDRMRAALDGAREVWGAVLASTLTTMAVFIPVITIQEEAGQLFKDIAIAIASAVGLSLLVSVLVIPPLAAKVLGGRQIASKGDRTWFVAKWVSALVAAMTRRTSTRVAVVVGLSGLAVLGSWLLAPNADYLPTGNQNFVMGALLSPPGYAIDEFKKMARIVEDGDPDDPYDGIRAAWETEADSPQADKLPPVQIKLGKGGEKSVTVTPPPIEDFFYVAHGGTSFMGCTSKVETNVAPLVQVLNRAGSRIPGVWAFFNQASLFRSGRTGNSVDVEVRGDNLDEVVSAAAALQGMIISKGYGYPQPDPPNFALGRPEVQLVPNRTKAADVGLDVPDVGFIVRACVDGAFIGEYNDRGDKIDMAIKVAGMDDASIRDVGNVPIYTPSGHVIPIASVVDFEQTSALQQINHIEEMGAVTLSVTPKAGVPLEATIDELQNEIIAPLRRAGAVPSSVFTSLAGTADKLTQTKRALIGEFAGTVTWPRFLDMPVRWSLLILVGAIAVIILICGLFLGPRTATKVGLVVTALFVIVFMGMNIELAQMLFQSRAVLALVITYLLMAALFESFAYPFVIMFSVPLAAVGGFAALRIVHQVSLWDVTSPIQQLDVLTMLGFVILIGIVVNNAILIVHQALQYMRIDGQASNEAVVASVRTRTRPIVMSAMTSVFGMSPLVLMTGAGSELYRGIGSVVVGGLIFSTVFTLFVVPAVFSLFLDLRAWVVSHLQREAESGAPQPATVPTREPAVSSTPTPAGGSIRGTTD